MSDPLTVLQEMRVSLADARQHEPMNRFPAAQDQCERWGAALDTAIAAVVLVREIADPDGRSVVSLIADARALFPTGVGLCALSLATPQEICTEIQALASTQCEVIAVPQEPT